VIGTLTWAARIGEEILPAEVGNISIDDQNVPAITTSIQIPYDAALVPLLDPRVSSAIPRVQLAGTIVEWASQPVSAISAYADAEGGTVADLSAAWAGLTLGGVSSLFGARLHSFAPDTPQTMQLELHVRELQHDDWRIYLDLASDEALLTDWSVLGPFDVADLQDYQTGRNPAYVSTYVNSVLRLVLDQELEPSPYLTTAVDPEYVFDAVELSKGPTGWDIIREAMEGADLKLRVNPTGTGFTLQLPENAINNPAEHSWLFTPENVISARQVYSRTGDWYDSVMLSINGELVVTSGSSAAHSRTWREDMRPGSNPTSNMAKNMAKRTKNRGRLIDIVAPIRLGVFITDEFVYIPEGGVPGPEVQWRVKAVSYDFISGTMNIRGERRY
jgi:hypothetical protein